MGEGPLLYQLRPEILVDARLAVVGRYVILFHITGEVVRIERVVFGGVICRGSFSNAELTPIAQIFTQSAKDEEGIMQSDTIILHAGSSALPSIFTARPEARTRMREFFSSLSAIPTRAEPTARP
jgi:hypothetical protein